LIDLKPNQTKTVRFTLTEDALGFYDDDGNFTVQPGEFSIYVGGDSTANLTTKFNL
jgi:beta-glucosidase